MLRFALAAVTLAALLTSGAPAAAEPVVRAAVLKFGTVAWELETIRARELDRRNGFRLEIREIASKPGVAIAFNGGEADVIVTDWIWVSVQRDAGKRYQFLPYSKSVGGIMVPEDSSIRTLADLKERTIGVAGGPLDKSWLLLRALAEKRHGFDLADGVEPVFGAPPLLHQKALRGETEATLNFWHYLARLDANGHRTLISAAEAATALGLDPETPLLGYVFRERWARENPELAEGLRHASAAAKRILANEDEAWEPLRPMMRAEDDAVFEALKAGYRAGIPERDAVDEDAAGRMFALLARLSDGALTDGRMTMAEGVFYAGAQ